MPAHYLFDENKPPAYKDKNEKITAEQLFVLAKINLISQRPNVSTWSVLTKEISNFVWLNYKLSLYLRVETPNKLICIQI